MLICNLKSEQDDGQIQIGFDNNYGCDIFFFYFFF